MGKLSRAIVFWACRKEEYLKMAIASAKSAKRHMPDVDMVLLTDMGKPSSFDLVVRTRTPGPEDVCFPPLLDVPEKYDSGLYVGAKAHFCAPLNDVFDLVEGKRVDIALVHTSGKRHVDRLYPCPGVPEAFPHWRTSLVAFRHHDRMRKFFRGWADAYVHQKKHGLKGDIRYPDQPPMRTALYHSDLVYATLPPYYCCTAHNIVVRDTVRILPYPKGADPKKLEWQVNRRAGLARLLVGGKAKVL